MPAEPLGPLKVPPQFVEGERAILGGLLLGMVESLGAGFISSLYRDTIGFIILLLLFIFRPYGFFGKKTVL